MEKIDKLKFITETGVEYFILKNKFIENELYGYAVNKNNELDSMFVKIVNDSGNVYFELVTDKDIVVEILK